MSAISYFGITIEQPDGSVCVYGDQRFNPKLRYRENDVGDFYPIGPQMLAPPSYLHEFIANDGENVPAITCPRCQQRLAVFGPSKPNGDLEHRCSRVLSSAMESTR